MARQGSLFNAPPVLDLPTGKAGRDAGMVRAASAIGGGDFMAAASAAIRRTAEAKEEFIVDAVWESMPSGPRVVDNRAMGAALTVAKRAGWIKATGRWQSSAQKQNHANPRAVWRSLIYRAGAA